MTTALIHQRYRLNSGSINTPVFEGFIKHSHRCCGSPIDNLIGNTKIIQFETQSLFTLAGEKISNKEIFLPVDQNNQPVYTISRIGTTAMGDCDNCLVNLSLLGYNPIDILLFK